MLNPDPVYETVKPRGFFLRPDVFVVVGKDSATLLSLTKDKYFGMDTTQAWALSLVVDGWPQMQGASEIPIEGATRFAESLVESGLLTRDASVGKSFYPEALQHPEDAMVYRDERKIPRFRWHHVPAFLISLIQGFYWWKFRHLNKTIEHVKRPRPKRISATPIDTAELRNLVRVFYWVRPVFYEKYRPDPEKQAGLCLFDSLVMLAFLSKYRFYPTLVFAVQLRPYAAHSWVQEDQLILNGSPETVSAYDTIMTAVRGGT